jgi:hypothetical protein
VSTNENSAQRFYFGLHGAPASVFLPSAPQLPRYAAAVCYCRSVSGRSQCPPRLFGYGASAKGRNRDFCWRARSGSTRFEAERTSASSKRARGLPGSISCLNLPLGQKRCGLLLSLYASFDRRGGRCLCRARALRAVGGAGSLLLPAGVGRPPAAACVTLRYS